MNPNTQIKVWDLPVRLFHWSLATLFILAYAIEDHWLSLHTLAGYTIAGLVLFRLVWGFVGSRYARFGDFVKSPGEVMHYLGDIKSGRAGRYLGHNPAGGAMIIALLLSLVFTIASGLIIYGGAEFAGPLAGVVAGWPESRIEMFEEVHEFFANFTLLLVLLHVAGVVLASFQHGENLVRSMFTGKKAVH